MAKQPIHLPNIRPSHSGARLVPVHDLRDLQKLMLLMLGVQFVSLAFQVASYGR
jgi:hypothetical protein